MTARTLHLDAESLRLVEYDYQQFVKAGANLSEADKAKLKKLNEEESTLENAFMTKLLAATEAARTRRRTERAGRAERRRRLAAAAEAAQGAQGAGWRASAPKHDAAARSGVSDESRHAAGDFENSWNRAERGGANDTRATIARLAQLRAKRARCWGTRIMRRGI